MNITQRLVKKTIYGWTLVSIRKETASHFQWVTNIDDKLFHTSEFIEKLDFRKVNMATWADLKSQGIKRFGEAGAWAFDEWKMLNDTFFNGENKPGAIIWGQTPQGKSLGYYHVSENLIYLNKNLMRPVYPSNYFNWGIQHLNKRIAGDVLLHEMIHQRINQTGGWVGETSHNNVRFVDEVNRIARLLGMDIKAKVIKQKTTREKPIWHVEPGCLTLKELSDFPYSSRTYNYYYGHP